MATEAEQASAELEQDRLAQQRGAITQANQVREQIAELRDQLRRKLVDPWQLIRGEVEQWEPLVKRMKLRAMLVSVPGIGDATAFKVMAALRLPPNKRMEQLGYEVREELVTVARAEVGEVVT